VSVAVAASPAAAVLALCVARYQSTSKTCTDTSGFVYPSARRQRWQRRARTPYAPGFGYFMRTSPMYSTTALASSVGFYTGTRTRAHQSAESAENTSLYTQSDTTARGQISIMLEHTVIFVVNCSSAPPIHAPWGCPGRLVV
jgi:hypothetical protein